jgi:hypothetical protein
MNLRDEPIRFVDLKDLGLRFCCARHPEARPLRPALRGRPPLPRRTRLCPCSATLYGWHLRFLRRICVLPVAMKNLGLRFLLAASFVGTNLQVVRVSFSLCPARHPPKLRRGRVVPRFSKSVDGEYGPRAECIGNWSEPTSDRPRNFGHAYI